MSLDIFQDDAAQALNDASNRIAPDLPAGFSESLSTNWRAMTDFYSSVGYQASRAEALGEFGDDVFSRTGVRLSTTAYGEGLISSDEFNASIQKLNDDYPVNLAPLTDGDVDRMALNRMAKARQGADALSQREKTWGGTFGGIVGTTAGALADPIAAMTLPLGGAGELGIIGRAVEFGLISGGTTAATAAASGAERERAVPGSAAEIPGEIISSTLFGAGLGGAFGALGQWLKAGNKTLPTSLRDEVNAATSEAQLNATNPFPTAAGEIAARDATVQAVHQAARGEPITVGTDFDPAHVQAFAESVGARTPEDVTQAAEQVLRPLTWREVPDVEHFDPVPGPGDDAASYWNDRLATASPEERAALGDFPDRWYHGTTGDFESFDLGNAGIVTGANSAKKAIFLSDDPALASEYAKIGPSRELLDLERQSREAEAAGDTAKFEDIESKIDRLLKAREDQGGGANVRAAFVDGDFALHDLKGERFDDAAMTQVMDDARAAGKDGVKFVNAQDWPLDPGEPSTVLAVFDPSKIRSAFAHPPVLARDLGPTETAALAADPQTFDAVQKALIDYRIANPDAEYSVQVRQPDGTFQLTTRKLADVMADIDRQENLANELMTCAIGAAAP